MRSTRFASGIAYICGCAMLLLVTGSSMGQTICDQTPYEPDDLAAPGFTPPGPSKKGYFTADIGMNGDGNLAIIGEYGGGGDATAPGPGIARIYELGGNGWEQTHAIQQSNPVGGDRFGISVDIDDDFAIAAAPLHGDGAVYFFKYDAFNDEWAEHQRILNPGDPGNGYSTSGAQHEGVAIDGDLAAVSAVNATVYSVSGAGVVYTYAYDSGNDRWLPEQRIDPPTPTSGAYFGHSIELSGDRLIIGAPFGSNGGEVFIYKRSVTGGSPTWALEEDFDAGASGGSGDAFGQGVSINGNVAAVGAPGEEIAFIYAYSVSTGSWYLFDDVSPNPSENDDFGYNVSIGGSLCLIGARLYDDGTYTGGAAYVYERDGSSWSAERILVSNNALSDDRVGETLALVGDDAFVGVLSYDISGIGGQEGGLMIFEDMPDGCP